jgi:hypothetical protein
MATAQYEGNGYLIIKGESSVAGSYSLRISGVSRSIARDVQRGLRPGLFRLRLLGSFRPVNAETIAAAFASGVECFLQLENGNRVRVQLMDEAATFAVSLLCRERISPKHTQQSGTDPGP